MVDNFVEGLLDEIESFEKEPGSNPKIVDLKKESRRPKQEKVAGQKMAQGQVNSATNRNSMLNEQTVDEKVDDSNGDSPQHSEHQVNDSRQNRRILSKARIQKSIRFRPELIARLDEYFYQRELKGEEEVSIQYVQNEALKLWLEKHERQQQASANNTQGLSLVEVVETTTEFSFVRAISVELALDTANF